VIQSRSKGLRLLLAATVVVLSSPKIEAQATAVTLRYDFEHLMAGDLHGQDNWVTVNNVHNPAHITHKIGSGMSSQYSSFNASKAAYFDWEGSGYGSRSTRINNQSFSTPAIGLTGITVIEMDANRAFWGSQFRMGYDADSNGDISDTELGLRFSMRSVGTSWKTKLQIGTQEHESTTPVGNYGRYQIVLDRDTDTASVWLKNYSASLDWAPIATLTNVSDGFTSDSTRHDPSTWNGFGFHGEGRTSAFDNISFRQIHSSTRSLDFSATDLNTTARQTLQISGQYFTQSLTATLTGDYTFDDGTQSQSIGVGTTIGIRFTPTTEGSHNGALTLAGEEMNAPLVVNLAGTGVVYIPPTTTVAPTSTTTTVSTADVPTTTIATPAATANVPVSDAPTASTSRQQQITAPPRSIPPPTSTTPPARVTTTTTTIPDVDESVVLVNGSAVTSNVDTDGESVSIEAGVVIARIKALDKNGDTVALLPSGQLQLDKAVALNVTVKGLLPLSEVRVWMRSTPILLGTSKVSTDGTVSDSYNVSAPTGEHRIIIDGLNELSQSITMGIGANANPNDTSSASMALIIVPLAIAVALAVFLPPVVRRRRRTV
jgi:hypothetical protein